MKLHKNQIILTLIAIALLIMVPGCGKKKAAPTEEVKKPVKLSSVPTGTIKRDINFTGTFISRNRTEVLPRVSGRVIKVYVEEGDHVRKGQILVKLEDEDFLAQLNQARAALGVARARLGQARSGYRLSSRATTAQVGAARQGIDLSGEGINQARASYKNALAEYNRMTNLYRNGAISRQTLDNVTTQYQIAKSRLEAAKAQKKQARENLRVAVANTNQAGVSLSDINAAAAGIRQAQANVDYLKVMLGYTTMKAPIAGVVVARNVEPGQLIAPGNKTPSIIITDNSVVYLESEIPESEIRDVNVGNAVTVTVSALDNRQFQGRVKSIIPSADPSSRTFRIKVSVDNQSEIIKNGMSARATMDVEELSGMVIPRQWLKIIEGEFYVVTPNGNKRAAHKRVTLGYYNEVKALVNKGLKPGEKLIAIGQDTLKDGDLLEIQGEIKPEFNIKDTSPKSDKPNSK